MIYTGLLLLVTIIWGSTFVIIKDTVTSINPFFIVFSRTFIAAISMLLIVFLKNKQALFHRHTIFQGSLLGLLLATTYASQTYGLKFTSSGHSGFITGSAVILVPLILYLFLKETITRATLFSVCIVFCGLFFLAFDTKTAINIGDIITLLTACSYAIHIILSGRFVKKTDALSLIAYQFVFACLFSFIALLFTKNFPQSISIKSYTSILYLGFVGTLFCYFISVWSQKYVDSIKVIVIFSLESVFAALFGYLVYKEVLVGRELLGAGMILSGVLFYQLQKYFKFFNNSSISSGT